MLKNRRVVLKSYIYLFNKAQEWINFVSHNVNLNKAEKTFKLVVTLIWNDMCSCSQIEVYSNNNRSERNIKAEGVQISIDSLACYQTDLIVIILLVNKLPRLLKR